MLPLAPALGSATSAAAKGVDHLHQLVPVSKRASLLVLQLLCLMRLFTHTITDIDTKLMTKVEASDDLPHMDLVSTPSDGLCIHHPTHREHRGSSGESHTKQLLLMHRSLLPCSANCKCHTMMMMLAHVLAVPDLAHQHLLVSHRAFSSWVAASGPAAT